MAYELIQSGRTEFAIDWSVVRRLLRSYYTSDAQLRYASEVSLSDSHWYNPLSWSLPDVLQLEVDWDAVQRYANAYSENEAQYMQQQAKYDATSVARRLEGMIEYTDRNREQFIDWMGDVQTRNMQRIDQAIKDYDADTRMARWIRDTSADGLMVGASIMSGGTATAVMAGGSFLKGQAKFQDSGQLGAALMEGTGSFVFAYVRLGKTFSLKQDVVLAVVQAPYKIGTEIVAGAAVGKATASGTLKLTEPVLKSVFKNLEKAPMPVVITYGGEDVAGKFIGKMTAKIAQRGIEDYTKSKLSAARNTDTNNEQSDAPTHSQGRVIAEATLSNKYLLYLAFVNQEKGIGRGW